MGIEENLLNRRIATITVGLAALVVSGAISYIWYGRKAKKNITFIESENINSIFPSTCDFEETPFTSDVKEISPSACDVIKKSSENPAELANSTRLRGNKLFKDQKFEEALKCYSESLCLYPLGHADTSIVHSNMAAAYMSIKQLEKAKVSCDAALMTNPKFVKALDRRSRILSQTGHHEDALVDALSAAVIDKEKSPGLYEHVEELLVQISEIKAKEQYKVRNIELPEPWVIKQSLFSFPRELRDAQTLASDEAHPLSQPYSLVAAECYEDAYKLMLKMIENKNELENITKEIVSELYNWIGLFQLLSGDFENARNSLQTSIEANPLATGPRLKLALVYMELSLIPEMSVLLEDALRIDDTDAAAYYHRGEILAMSGRMEDAISDFSRAIQLDAEFHSAHVRRARAYQTLGRTKEAKDILTRSIKLFPETSELHHALAECYAMEENFDEAIAVFEKIDKMSSGNPQISLTKAIILHIKDGIDLEYGNALKNIIKDHPDFGTARIQYAGYLLKQKNHNEALEQYEIAAKQARSFQDLITIHSHLIISNCQHKVVQRFPELCDVIHELMTSVASVNA